MGRRSSEGPTDAESEILHILWQKGPCTVRTVFEALNRIRETKYTTALKMLQIMTGKKLVERDESRRSHVYEARVSRKEVQEQMLGSMLDRFFEGSCEKMLLRALRAKRVSQDELAKMRGMLDAFEEE